MTTTTFNCPYCRKATTVTVKVEPQLNQKVYTCHTCGQTFYHPNNNKKSWGGVF